jgi:hypothetical protein
MGLAIAGDTDNRSHGAGKDSRMARKVARQIPRDPKEAPHGLLAKVTL